MQVKMNADDFNNLYDAAMEWGESWRVQKDRFDSGISFFWKYAYFFDMAYANLILAREYLKDSGQSFEITSDEAGGWVILTNYDALFYGVVAV